jgi:hypothetical protein
MTTNELLLELYAENKLLKKTARSLLKEDMKGGSRTFHDPEDKYIGYTGKPFTKAQVAKQKVGRTVRANKGKIGAGVAGGVGLAALLAAKKRRDKKKKLVNRIKALVKR